MQSDGSSNETDQTGLGGDLIVQSSSIPRSTDVPPGYNGYARDFEKNNTDYMSHTDGKATDIYGTGQNISIVAWVKLETAGVAASPVSKYDYGTNNKQYSFRIDVDGTLWFRLSADGSTNSITVTGNTDVGTDWTHVAAVYNGTDIRLYVNGVLDNTPTSYTGDIYNGNAPFLVGVIYNNSAPDTWWRLDGLITDVAIFDRALSVSEIIEIKNYGVDGTRGRRIFIIQEIKNGNNY